MVYKSRKDAWLVSIVWGAMLFAIGSGIYGLVTQPLGVGEAVITIAFTLLLPIFVLWLVFTVEYVVSDQHLIVRNGPFRRTIPLDTIRAVRKTINPLSSPALSLHRLEIKYSSYDVVMISPKDRDAFMKLLAARCPQAEIMD